MRKTASEMKAWLVHSKKRWEASVAGAESAKKMRSQT